MSLRQKNTRNAIHNQEFKARLTSNHAIKFTLFLRISHELIGNNKRVLTNGNYGGSVYISLYKYIYISRYNMGYVHTNAFHSIAALLKVYKCRKYSKYTKNIYIVIY